MKNINTQVSKLLMLSLFFFLTTIVSSQSPDLINYQAVLRDAGGQVLSNTSTSIKVQIREATSSGNVVYNEEHSVTTSNLGMVNFAIGQGSNQSGSVASINWGAASYFLEILIDSSGQYVSMGVSQLLSVPYALYAKNSGGSGTQGATGLQGITGAEGDLSLIHI